MAEKPQKIMVQPNRIDASILPPGFSLAYKLYVIQQTTDLQQIAEASNNANGLAYEATIRNQEQDLILDNHSIRIAFAEENLQDHEVRISNAEGAIVAIIARVTTAENDIDYLQEQLELSEKNISDIQKDYVSKSAVTIQALASPLNVDSSFSVNGTKVVGPRQTGFTPASGTANKGAFNADASYAVSSTYTQSQIQAMANDLRAARQRVKALEDALRAHGLIN